MTLPAEFTARSTPLSQLRGAAIVILAAIALNSADAAAPVGTGCRAEPTDVCILSQALAGARRLPDTGSRIYRLIEVGSVLATGRDNAQGRAVFAEVHRHVRRLQDRYARNAFLAALAEARAASGDTGVAHATVREMDAERRRRAMTRVAKARADKGDVLGAQQSLRAIGSIPPSIPATDLARIAQVQVRIGELPAARATLARAEARWRQEAVKSWSGLLVIAELQLGAGAKADGERNLEEATLALQTIAGEASADWDLRELARVQALTGSSQAALATSRRIASDELRVGSLLDIARARANAGDFRVTDAVLAEVRRTSSPTKDSHQQDRARLECARIMAEARRVEAALEDTRAIEEPTLRVFALAEVAAAQAKLGRAAEARATIIEGLDAIDGIAHEEARVLALTAIGEAAQALGRAR